MESSELFANDDSVNPEDMSSSEKRIFYEKDHEYERDTQFSDGDLVDKFTSYLEIQQTNTAEDVSLTLPQDSFSCDSNEILATVNAEKEQSQELFFQNSMSPTVQTENNAKGNNILATYIGTEKIPACSKNQFYTIENQNFINSCKNDQVQEENTNAVPSLLPSSALEPCKSMTTQGEMLENDELQSGDIKSSCGQKHVEVLNCSDNKVETVIPDQTDISAEASVVKSQLPFLADKEDSIEDVSEKIERYPFEVSINPFENSSELINSFLSLPSSPQGDEISEMYRIPYETLSNSPHENINHVDSEEIQYLPNDNSESDYMEVVIEINSPHSVIDEGFHTAGIKLPNQDEDVSSDSNLYFTTEDKNYSHDETSLNSAKDTPLITDFHDTDYASDYEKIDKSSHSPEISSHSCSTDEFDADKKDTVSDISDTFMMQLNRKVHSKFLEQDDEDITLITKEHEREYLMNSDIDSESDPIPETSGYERDRSEHSYSLQLHSPSAEVRFIFEDKNSSYNRLSHNSEDSKVEVPGEISTEKATFLGDSGTSINNEASTADSIDASDHANEHESCDSHYTLESELKSICNQTSYVEMQVQNNENSVEIPSGMDFTETISLDEGGISGTSTMGETLVECPEKPFHKQTNCFIDVNKDTDSNEVLKQDEECKSCDSYHSLESESMSICNKIPSPIDKGNKITDSAENPAVEDCINAVSFDKDNTLEKSTNEEALFKLPEKLSLTVDIEKAELHSSSNLASTKDKDAQFQMEIAKQSLLLHTYAMSEVEKTDVKKNTKLDLLSMVPVVRLERIDVQHLLYLQESQKLHTRKVPLKKSHSSKKHKAIQNQKTKKKAKKDEILQCEENSIRTSFQTTQNKDPRSKNSSRSSKRKLPVSNFEQPQCKMLKSSRKEEKQQKKVPNSSSCKHRLSDVETCKQREKVKKYSLSLHNLKNFDRFLKSEASGSSRKDSEKAISTQCTNDSEIKERTETRAILNTNTSNSNMTDKSPLNRHTCPNCNFACSKINNIISHMKYCMKISRMDYSSNENKQFKLRASRRGDNEPEESLEDSEDTNRNTEESLSVKGIVWAKVKERFWPALLWEMEDEIAEVFAFTSEPLCQRVYLTIDDLRSFDIARNKAFMEEAINLPFNDDFIRATRMCADYSRRRIFCENDVHVLEFFRILYNVDIEMEIIKCNNPDIVIEIVESDGDDSVVSHSSSRSTVVLHPKEVEALRAACLAGTFDRFLKYAWNSYITPEELECVRKYNLCTNYF